MTSSEFILAGDFLLTMDRQNRVIPGGAVHIADGRILAVDTLQTLGSTPPSGPAMSASTPNAAEGRTAISASRPAQTGSGLTQGQ